MNDSVGRSRADQQRIKVALVFGGRSSEHAISCVSAGSILRNLDQAVYEVVAVGVTPEGGWVLTDGDPAQLAISDRTLPQVTDASGTELLLATDPRRAGQLVNVDWRRRPGAGLGGCGVPGTARSLWRGWHHSGTVGAGGVPYVGAGVLASAAGMDKEFTKKLLAAEGLPIGKYAVIRPRDTTLTLDQREDLGLPVFVKPARAGSSFGVSRVTAWEELPAAIAHARQFDPKVIVEAAIVGRELECGVLEFPDGDIRASVLGEIRVEGVNRTRRLRVPSTTSRPSTWTTPPNWTYRPRSTTT